MKTLLQFSACASALVCLALANCGKSSPSPQEILEKDTQAKITKSIKIVSNIRDLYRDWSKDPNLSPALTISDIAQKDLDGLKATKPSHSSLEPLFDNLEALLRVLVMDLENPQTYLKDKDFVSRQYKKIQDSADELLQALIHHSK